jgi:hypothetical protein
VESRLAESFKEVKEAGSEAVEKVQKAEQALAEAFERKAGRKEMAQLLRNLHFAVKHVPANMEFAAKSLAETAENVVTKARADIEGMVAHAIANGELPEGGFPQLGSGV